MDCLSTLNIEIKEKYPATPVAVEPDYGQNTYPDDNATGSTWWGSSEDAGGWGASPRVDASAENTEADDGWGERSAVQANGWGGSPSKDRDEGWNAGNTEKGGGGWGASEVLGRKEVSNKIRADDDGWGEPSSNADVEVANGWDTHTVATDGGWGTEENPAATSNADAWGAGQKSPAATDGWDVSEQPQDTHETSGWGHRSPEVLEMPNTSHRELSGGVSRRDEPRKFHPTGANTIPLGKIRQFGPKPVGGGSDSVIPISTPMSMDDSLLCNINDGTTGGSPAVGGETLDSGCASQEDNLESGWDVPDVIDAIEPVSDWSLAAVQEVAPDSGWGSLESQPSAHSNPSWSPKVPYGQARAGRTSTPRRITAVADTAKSEDWREIVEIVRAVRNILQT
jgi:hypothetical protein